MRCFRKWYKWLAVCVLCLRSLWDSFPLFSLHLQREGHTFQCCFPTLALGDAQLELISDGAPAPTHEPPTSTSSPYPSVLNVLLGNSALCPTSVQPTPSSTQDEEVFKEIDGSLIFRHYAGQWHRSPPLSLCPACTFMTWRELWGAASQRSSNERVISLEEWFNVRLLFYFNRCVHR